VDGGVDLVGGEAAAAHRHVVSVEDVADRPPFDTEPRTKLVHRSSGLVAGDEFLDLVGVKVTRSPRFRVVDGWWGWCGGVG